jgi:hypothetical protein
LGSLIDNSLRTAGTAAIANTTTTLTVVLNGNDIHRAVLNGAEAVLCGKQYWAFGNGKSRSVGEVLLKHLWYVQNQ